MILAGGQRDWNTGVGEDGRLGWVSARIRIWLAEGWAEVRPSPPPGPPCVAPWRSLRSLSPCRCPLRGQDAAPPPLPKTGRGGTKEGTGRWQAFWSTVAAATDPFSRAGEENCPGAANVGTNGAAGGSAHR